MGKRRSWPLFSFAVLFGFAVISVSSAAQTTAPDQWAWMGGSQAVNDPGVYGALGVFAPANRPMARLGAASWTDNKGNFWIFGGRSGFVNGIGYQNDLWEFSPAINQWAWVSGSAPVPNSQGPSGNYSAPGAVPGGRDYAYTWTDSSGFLWLFGGDGIDGEGALGFLGDLWKFDPTTSVWTFVGGGDQICGTVGTMGTQGKASQANWPGCRANGVSLMDQSGNFWLIGGITANENITDVWEYNRSTGEWAWMNGLDGAGSEYGTYGTLGTPNAANFPGSRMGATGWADKSGNLWIFGGNGYGAGVLVNGNESDNGYLNDLWKYNTSNNEWAWMGGSDSVIPFTGVPAVYGTLGMPATGNVPSSRTYASGWVDNQGNFWLFGGFGTHDFDDLWVFESASGKWGWMNGNGDVVPPFLSYDYGAVGVPAEGNFPGNRDSASSWSDASGNLWLFGGVGASPGGQGALNDLWKIQPSTSATYQTVPTPTFSAASGNYTFTARLAISDASGNADIFYTLDGSAPTESSNFYDPAAGYPLMYDSSPETIRAIAIQTNYFPSAEADVTYNLTYGYAATITVTPASSSISEASPISVAIAMSGASGNATPTGTVTLTSGSYSSAVIALVNGSATIDIPANSLPVGSDTLTANYSGDTNYDSGSGTAALAVTTPPSFTLSGPAVTVLPGAVTGNTSTITVTPTSGFTGSVALTASITSSPAGAQYAPTLSFGSTTPVAISGATAGAATLTVSTTAATSGALVIPKRPGAPWYAAGSAALAFILFFGNLRRRSGWRTLTGMFVLLLMLAGGVVACGGGGSGTGGGGGGGGGGIAGTTAGAYTITVTGTSGAITSTGTVTLTVQ